jgi:hypothetical protein
MHHHQPTNIIITQGVNSDERTPEAAAVVITKAEEGQRNSCPSTVLTGNSSAFVSKINFVTPYLERIANVVTSVGREVKCPGYVVVGQCENGHQFVKEIYCGREWCPVCGEDGSIAHNRRFSRWVTKAQEMRTMGYLVFTMPIVTRGNYRNKASLNELTKRVCNGDKSRRIKGLLKEMGFTRGLARWHWFGDTPGKWNPHLNVIIEAGRLTKLQLETIRLSWAGILGVDNAVVNYSYTAEIPKMVHILKYVTRATFREYNWNPFMAGALYNFRNMRYWGVWGWNPVWQLEQSEGNNEAISALESGNCPVCGTPVTWTKAMDIKHLEIWASYGIAHSIGSGYWQLDTS